eukprot:5298249-Pyramimonas_sp.AAC.1
MGDSASGVIQDITQVSDTQSHNYVQGAPFVLSEDQATRMIQRAWRRFSSVKVYRYYRDMINFRERGDPSQLLRVINPRVRALFEAALLDAATGCHLRFRLGGLTFPPIIYYKIFTHRPVTDICAFGPRDYCRQVRAFKPAECLIVVEHRSLSARAL